MDKSNSSLVKRFQQARLDEWIGDLKGANEIYEDLKKETADKVKGLAYILEPIIKERKKKVEDKLWDQGIAGKIADSPFDDYSIAQEVSYDEPVLIFDPQKLQPKSTFENISLPQNVNWKYTVTISSRVNSDCKLEIKGYYPENVFPRYISSFQDENLYWQYSVECESDADTDPDLYIINGESKNYPASIYLAIDRWGLISGLSIIDESNLGDYLIHVHYLICNLDNLFWPK